MRLWAPLSLFYGVRGRRVARGRWRDGFILPPFEIKGTKEDCNQKHSAGVHCLFLMNDSIDRRSFLKRASAAGVGLGIAGCFGPLARAGTQTKATLARKIGANDKIRSEEHTSELQSLR